MLTTPKALRLHIALMGRVNSGKSTILNLISGQEVALTSPQEGTTTDVVEKNQELLPLGPVTWMDTAGLGDKSSLGRQRMIKTQEVFKRSDVILLVCEGSKIGEFEEEIIAQAQARQIPLIKIYNKADLYPVKEDGISVCASDLSARDDFLNKLKAALIKVCPEEFLTPPPLCGDLVPKGGQVVMIVPIDYEAPKGRLILPQVQAIRDCLDHSQMITVVKEGDYLSALENMKTPPSLVICDSQVVDFMVANTKEEIPCTTFSILFARLKGDLSKFVEGAGTISLLQDNDKILIAESCTHHAQEDDIGTVKIPRWLKAKTGKNLIIDHVSGHDFSQNLREYKLVIQCGGCMNTRREMLSRINICEQAQVPITNYGVCISELKGVLPRVLQPFPQALQKYWQIVKKG